MSNYDSWHQSHVGDNDLETIWHSFVKNELQEADINDKVVLEIGCGRGGFSYYLVRQYPGIRELFSCDYSETALEIGRTKYRELSKITWQKEDIQRLTFRDASFDTVISCETIEHLLHPGKALEEIYRVLKPGGRFILTCPNYFNLFGVWCLYRKLIGKPYTEGGQPFVNYLLIPLTYGKLKTLGFRVEHFHSSEFVVPGRIPKTFYPAKTPSWLACFGSRTFYTLSKK